MNTLLAAALAICLQHRGLMPNTYDPGFEQCVQVHADFEAERQRIIQSKRDAQSKIDHAVIDRALEEKP